MREREELTSNVEKLLQQINTEVIKVLGKRIKTIGRLSSEELTSINRLLDFYGQDMATINKRLSELSDKTVAEIEKMLIESAKEAGIDVAQYYEIAGVTPIPYEKNAALQRIVAAAVKNASDTILAISNTTALGFFVNGQFRPMKTIYNTLIDKAILSVVTGAVDYKTAMQGALKEIGQGVRIVYQSGHTMRADSAVRMNVLDGMRQMNREIRKQQGQEFGADGVYIMPHGLCAPDHLPYQGKEYTYEEWDRLNSLLSRPIGTGVMNCGHVAYDVIVGASEKPYTDKQLQDIDDYSRAKVTWNGKELTRYEASQKMRNAETRIRELKDIKAVYKASGDSLNEARYNKYINEATAKYKARCKEAGLKARLDRL